MSIGWETTEGLRTDSLAGDVDSHNIVCSWCAQAHVSIHACDFTNGYVQGQEIDRNLVIVFQLKAFQKHELQAEILASHVPVYGAKDAGRGLWRSLGRSRSHELCVARILGCQRRTLYLEDKTRTPAPTSRLKTTLSEHNQSLRTRNTA